MLAHAVGNAVTRAFLRTTMLERRRKVMADWAAILRARAMRRRSCRSKASGDAEGDQPARAARHRRSRRPGTATQAKSRRVYRPLGGLSL
jgi:hypothetical protein